MASSNDIRATFLDYFARNGHTVVASSPLVPRNDPTLLFTNAGMVQFKNVFTGQEKRPYNRAATAQKCVRAGGKHNDLDNVGYTARHHTFFEMLGNFSFGDYFKDQAIHHAWTLVTKDFGLPKDRLLVTVFSEDEEAAALWHKIAGLPDERIIRIPTSDNFWRMGDTGPCGPCSEIFFDHGPSIPGGPPGSPDEDGDRFIEIWNLVFMQFEEGPPGTRVPLPHPSIDTGMGLERFAAILQGKHDNYDTDTLRALILASAEATGQEPDGPHRISHRVVADHLRSTAFLIADGVLPSNEGRGYVLRRIMRRAMRHAHMMGAREPVMWRLVPALVRQMGAAYEELIRAETLIEETLKLEETRFKAMLERGLGLLSEETAKLGSGSALSGEVAFKLYDTYGFPLDLTQDALREQGRGVDVEGFNAAMAEQRRRARAAWAGSGEAATDRVWFEVKEKVGATEFLGYSTERAEGEIIALVADGHPVERAASGTEVAVVLNQTPFYGESGGQVGDGGVIAGPGLRIAITDTQKKLGDLFVHVGRVEEGEATVGTSVVAEVDHARRTAIRSHHSATHLLHEALRRRLGTHVTQKGSLNAPDRLRFDVSQPTPIGRDDLAWVEDTVNAKVRENTEVTTRLMTPDAAVAEGAMALFGEKYGDEVRVVAMGGKDGNKLGWSVELCGGTHVRRTGDIGLFRIVGESAVSAGVRRIEAVTGEAALALVAENDRRLAEVAAALRTNPADVAERVTALLEDRRKLERQVAELQKKLATGGGAAEVEEIGGVKLAARNLGDVPARDLKGLAEAIGKQIGPGVVALVSTAEGKASVVVGVSPELAGRFNAVELVRAAAAAVGGKGGGGRPDMAQAGGPDGAQADAALEAVRAALAA
ncbi:alanine--tRNA ligase/DNA-binding transcriptional repressor [Rhodovastum atsumiense]|uniref:Alanine--tRNA ligase n=1 Tax=Rhodovastum atsumiense TaxID=504468 RepID=A0A5M6IIR8_9PROT|nr:alanine--tRNA ligase [Rhodovastum atsumiense]KAA5608042.1 alanine--tRNA ligase [Rhodovastum atsumiense]CAH2599354.1 alanine--tRNA ligase/DNA-binding transcriptional repressor [Rhodovastum atsumiense]